MLETKNAFICSDTKNTWKKLLMTKKASETLKHEYKICECKFVQSFRFLRQCYVNNINLQMN